MVVRDLAEGEGGVLLHLDSGQYHGVNPVGLAVWELLEDGSTAGQIVERLRGRVQDPPQSLQGDVLQFLVGIHERDLVVVEQ